MWQLDLKAHIAPTEKLVRHNPSVYIEESHDICEIGYWNWLIVDFLIVYQLAEVWEVGAGVNWNKI